MQYFEYGIKQNGNYYIQKNNSIIQVYCQFDGMGYENCQDYFKNAYNESGYYWLYVNDISFKVYCDFSTGNASTTVGHSSKFPVLEKFCMLEISALEKCCWKCWKNGIFLGEF